MQNSTQKNYATILCLGLALLTNAPSSPSQSAQSLSRKVAFTYQVHVPPTPASGGKFLLWLPLPQEDKYQKIEDLHIDSPAPFKQGHDAAYGNPYVEFRPDAKLLEAGFDAIVRFVAVRSEHRVTLDSAQSVNSSIKTPQDTSLQRYLQPDRLVPLNGVIADLAKEQTAGDTTDLAKSKHI